MTLDKWNMFKKKKQKNKRLKDKNHKRLQNHL